MIGRRTPSNQFTNLPLMEPSCFPKQNAGQYRKTYHGVSIIDSINNNCENNSQTTASQKFCGCSHSCVYHTDSFPTNVPQIAEISLQQKFPRAEKTNYQCFRCEQFGHSHRTCSQPKTFNYCYFCGTKNYTVDNCPKEHRKPRGSNLQDTPPTNFRIKNSTSYKSAPQRNEFRGSGSKWKHHSGNVNLEG